MSVSPVAASDPRIESPVPQNDPTLLQRVYDFVFSNQTIFWIGLGCVGAAASLALAYFITPIFLVGLIPSAIMIILGSVNSSCSSETQVGDSNASRVEEGREIPRIVLPLIGIPNRPGNNCWAISLMQLILNTPSLETTILNHPDFQGPNYRVFGEFIRAYRESQARGERVFTRVSIQNIRIALHNIDPQEISLNGPEDFWSAYEIIWNNLPNDHPCKKQRREHISDEHSGLYLSRYIFHSYIIQDQERGFLWELEQQRNESRYRYLEPPPELMITTLPHAFPMPVEENVPVLEEFDLPRALTCNGEGGHYVCNSFIRYSGAHYSSYFKRNGTWFCCDDDRVTQLSPAQARDAFEKGLHYHYTKVS